MLAARSDRDLVISEPTRARPASPHCSAARPGARPVGARNAPAAPGRAASVATASGRLAWRGLIGLMRRPAESLLGTAMLAAAGLIVWNALVLQTQHHPAPLFGGSGAARPNGAAPLPPARPESSVAAPQLAPAALKPVLREPLNEAPRVSEPVRPTPKPLDLPPARPVAPGAAQRPAAAVPSSAPRDPVAGPARASEPKPAPLPAAARDPIADLLKGENPVPPALVGRPDATPLVSSAQRALAKLGYGTLKADGMMGPATREAILRFERERGLPETGELGSRTARALSQQSGIPVE